MQKKQNQEMTLLGSALRHLGGLGGGALGSLIGAPGIGATAGSGLGAAISKWLGSGDYEIAKNTVVQRSLVAGSTIPDMHKSDQSVIIRHREYITPVLSSMSFSIQSQYDINPGNSTLFPWLSTVAAAFQEYKIRGMVYHYVPTSGSAVASTNAALGSVMLQTTYRSSDSQPINKIEMLNEYNANESVPCDAFCHPVECDPKENPFNIQYVRSLPLANAEDKLLYDLGTTNLAVSGCQTTGNPIGDLWVTYEIELKKPLVTSNVTTSTRSFGVVVGSPPDSGHVFDGTQTTFGTLPVTVAANTVKFARGVRGYYQVMVRLNGPSAVGFNPFSWSGGSTFNNCTPVNGPTGAATLGTKKTGSADTIEGGWYVTWLWISDPSLEASLVLPTPSALTGAITYTVATVTWYNPLN